MLAEGRRVRLRRTARAALLLLAFVFLVGMAVPPSRADTPVQTPNGNATRTVTWTMNTSAGLVSDNVTFENGRAVLPWNRQTLAWNQSNQFVANGTLGSSMIANASGLGLRANWSNYVRNPTFTSSGSWRFVNGTTKKVTAEWNASVGAAEFGSAWTGDEGRYDSMDSNVVANWAGAGGPVLAAAVAQNTTNPQPVQGSGTMGIGVFTGADTWVAAFNKSIAATNWSSYDRLLLWVYLNVSVAATFNVTAHDGQIGPVLTTVAQRLGSQRGWQQVIVDLNQLGDSTARSALYQISFRFNSDSTFPNGIWLNVDDVRLGKAMIVNETASVSQMIPKANVTTPAYGSARLSFDWCLVNDTGVNGAAANVTLRMGSTPGVVVSLSSTTPGVWNSFVSDVSGGTTFAGTYNLTFGFRVAANTTAPYDAELLVDNVTLVFPEIANGTFTSSVLTMGEASQYMSLGWTGATPPATSVLVGLRTGNNSVPSSGSWSPWQLVSSRGPVALTVPSATSFQIEVDLNTTNASVAPSLQSLTLATRHRASIGNVTSDLFPAGADYLWWRSFAANTSLGARTSIQFWIGNGSSWIPATSSENLTAYTGGSKIEWRATLQTSDGLQTPALSSVTLIYDFLGPLARVRILTGSPVYATVGEWVHLTATAYDAGWHVVPLASSAFGWTGGDPSGHLYNNGSYLPAEPGYWNVTVSALGTSDTVMVIVNGTALNPMDSPLFPYALAILGAAAVGFVIYEIAIRRMFAIDDIFLIAKDGRLILHNTRRMRADRDEDILSGMLTAIMAFLRDQDPEENGELRRFQVGGKTTLLERGQHVYLTGIYSGRVPGWAGKDLHRFMEALEDKFGDAFAHWSGSPEDLHDLKAYMQRFVSRVRYHGPGRGVETN